MTQPPQPGHQPSGQQHPQQQWGAPQQPGPQHQQLPPQGPPPGYAQQQQPQQPPQYGGQQPQYGQPHPAQAPAPQWQQQPAHLQQPGQQYPGQRPPSPLGTGAFLSTHTGFFPLAFILYLTGPLIVIDGIEVGRQWGNQVIELGPGVHTIHIHTRYLWAIGNADQQFQIAPGQQLTASYETPFWVFSRGTILFR